VENAREADLDDPELSPVELDVVLGELVAEVKPQRARVGTPHGTGELEVGAPSRVPELLDPLAVLVEGIQPIEILDSGAEAPERVERVERSLPSE
jgi:hypothetical protein